MKAYKILKTCTIVGLFFALALPVSACAPLQRSTLNTNYASAPPAEQDAPAASGNAEETAKSGTANVVNQPAAPRLIVRNADLTIVISNTQAQIEAIGQIAADYKGYVVSSNTSKLGSDVQGSMTLRVDSAQLDAALQRIRNLAVEVRSENIRGDRKSVV